MKERLTVYTKTGCALKLDNPQNEIEARQQLMQKFKIACDKLAKFEDLMEKHNFESVEELTNHIKKLELIVKKGNQKLEEHYNQQVNELDEAYNKDLEERLTEINQLEQKVQELQEVDNKKSFKLYCVLYDLLEIQDPENVASRIEYVTSRNYADICEMYKTAKNLKQHDRELVKQVCEKIKKAVGDENLYFWTPKKEDDYTLFNIDRVLDDINKEYEDESKN